MNRPAKYNENWKEEEHNGIEYWVLRDGAGNFVERRIKRGCPFTYRYGKKGTIDLCDKELSHTIWLWENAAALYSNCCLEIIVMLRGQERTNNWQLPFGSKQKIKDLTPEAVHNFATQSYMDAGYLQAHIYDRKNIDIKTSWRSDNETAQAPEPVVWSGDEEELCSSEHEE